MEKAIRLVLVLLSCFFALLTSGQLTSPPETEALKAVRDKLKDPYSKLRNWKGDNPCVTNWTGVICTTEIDDGFCHVQELRMQNLNLSGKLAPEFGQLSNMTTLNFMWNNDIDGGIPKEISNLKSLQYLLLSGNKLSGPIPDELGYLPKLLIFRVDLNQISGSLPTSFVNLKSCKHLHMNNNSISGHLPPELSNMPSLIHILLDNNNLSGHIPSEYLQMPSLRILQLDNNNLGGTEIPSSYSNISMILIGDNVSALTRSLRNCSLTGAAPDLSGTPLHYLRDLSHNQLTGGIPTNKLSDNATTIDLSYNLLNGSISQNFSGLPLLQKLLLQNNSLTGAVPSTLWQNENFTIATARLIIDFRNNSLANISGNAVPPSNFTIMLDGNPICTSPNLLNKTLFCTNNNGDEEDSGLSPHGSSSNSNGSCFPCYIGDGYESVPNAPACFCAAPLLVVLRLRSPTISYFTPYINPYTEFITSSLGLLSYQLIVESYEWEVRRLRLYLELFPQYSNSTGIFNESEIIRITGLIANFKILTNDTYGPYELIDFPPGAYTVEFPIPKSGISKGALIGIILGAISLTVSLSLIAILVLVSYKRRKKSQHEVPKNQSRAGVPIRTGRVKEFSFVELEAATNDFSDTIGQGGYGKVFRGILADGTVVAIKRARQGSLQGQIEFITEIELLSRLHHRNLVSLVGYCGEQGEQMLVYEFMPNGSLDGRLSDRYRHTLTFPLRMRIALGAAKGILYLHTEADPPIIHRDIKANNILLDSKFTPKVSDFGISRLAPIPDAEGRSVHISTVDKGTPDYLDPEYFLTHKLTEKSDVYSLGIVFLELLTGMMPISHGRNIVREVHGACQAGLMFSIIDRSMGSYSSECIKKFMALALICCQDDPKDRPTMLKTVRELENMCSLLPESDATPTESDASGGVALLDRPLYSGRNSQVLTTEILGSELISGVIPPIKPR